MKCVWWNYYPEGYEFYRPGGLWWHKVLPDDEADKLAREMGALVRQVKITMPHDCPGDHTCEAWKWRRLHLKAV